MKIQCEYCGSLIEDTDENCSYCGAPNENLKRYINKDLDTIEELKQWYKDNYFPSEDLMRFFIGKNRKTPNSFGIYKKGDKFIVYQNSDDGSRTIYYEGPDEAYAVNIIALRLKEVVFDQKVRNLWTTPQARNAAKKRSVPVKKTSKDQSNSLFSSFLEKVIMGILYFFLMFSIDSCEDKLFPKPKHGYYYASSSENIYYYVEYSNRKAWFKYDDGEWYEYKPSSGKFPPEINGNQDRYGTNEEIEEKYDIIISECKER